MELKAEYLKIHERAYLKLRENGKPSWSESRDLQNRMEFCQNIFREICLHPEAEVLVIGCGDGEICLSLANAGSRVTGWDISPAAIDWATEKARDRDIKAKFYEKNVCENFTSSKSYDVVLDDHCLHCIVGEDRATVLKNIRLHLKDHGYFILRTHCGNPPPTMKKEVLDMWDPTSRCQIHKGIAGRYFGLEIEIIKEIESAGFSLRHKKVISDTANWPMLEALFCCR